MNARHIPVPTGIEVDVHSDRLAVCCEFEGARFHVWTDFDLRPHDATVFKNPPKGAEQGKDFSTRRLDSRKGQGKVVFDAMMAAAPALLPQALERKAAVASAARAKRERLHAEHLVREAAPDLLAALESLTAAYQQHFDVMPVAWQTFDSIAQAAIDKAYRGETS